MEWYWVVRWLRGFELRVKIILDWVCIDEPNVTVEHRALVLVHDEHGMLLTVFPPAESSFVSAGHHHLLPFCIEDQK